MTTEHTTNWPDLAMGLYERLTGKNAVIAYEFSDMHVKIPSGTGPKAGGAHYLFRFAGERCCTVNTAAAGGNAALIASSE